MRSSVWSNRNRFSPSASSTKTSAKSLTRKSEIYCNAPRDESPAAAHPQSLDVEAFGSKVAADDDGWSRGQGDIGGASMEDISRSINNEEESKRESGVPG